MATSLTEELIDAVYRSALEPACWPQVMQLIRQRFPSSSQTFYFLHRQSRRIQPVWLSGIAPQWVRCFDALYFAADNPWMRHTEQLHRPGVVRTNERLDRFLKARGALYRSSYYNDWMRPQDLKYTIGNTLLAEGGLVANITLFRPPDMPTFSTQEVQGFEALSRHMTRALQMGMRLERPDTCPASVAAFDAMPQAVAMVDAQCRLLYANTAMQWLLRPAGALVLRQGVLRAAEPAQQPRLAALVADALATCASGRPAAAPLRLQAGERRHLVLHAMQIVGRLEYALVGRPTVLLTASEAEDDRAAVPAAMRQRYGCTRSEARLVQLIAEGNTLRQAADAMGITYGTARTYLKLVFDKTGARTQAQLVVRVLVDTPATPDM